MSIDICLMGDTNEVARIRDWAKRLRMNHPALLQSHPDGNFATVLAEMKTFLDEATPEVLYDDNTTHNLVGMWKFAGCYETMYESDGKPAEELIPQLEKSFAFMQANEAECRKHDAPIGWGKYEHAMPFISNLLDACRRHPKATVRVSK